MVHLTVAETAAVARLNEVVTSGVPFPQGALKSADAVRLMDEKGVEVALQVAVTGTWRDGSVKWLLLNFPCSVGAGRTRRFGLEWGPMVRRKPVPAAAAAAARDFSLSEPYLRDIVVHVDGKELQQSTVASGNKQGREVVFVPRDRIVRKERIDWADWVTPAFASLFSLTARTSGPVGGTRQTTSYQIRQVSDQAVLSVTKWEIPLIKGVQVRSVAFGGGTPHPVKPNDQYVLMQETAARFVVTKNAKTVASGSRASGWLTVNLGDSTVTVAVREFAQQFPLTLVVRPDGVTLRAWASKQPFAFVRGMAKTFEVMTAEGGAKENGASSAAALLNRLFAVAPSSWYCASGALGRLLPVADPKLRHEDTGPEAALARELGSRAIGWTEWGVASSVGASTPQDCDTTAAFAIQFARTGARKWLDAMSVSANYASDFGTNHVTGQPWTKGTDTARKPGDLNSVYIQGLIDSAHLTGEPRSLETAKEIATWVSRQIRRGVENEGQVGLALDALCGVSEATADKKALDAAKDFVDTLVEEQEPSGKLGVKRPTDDAGYHGLALSGLLRYYDMVPSDTTRKAATLLADRILALPADGSGKTLDGLLRFYDMTHAERYLTGMMNTMEVVIGNAKERGWTTASAYFAGRHIRTSRLKP